MTEGIRPRLPKRELLSAERALEENDLSPISAEEAVKEADQHLVKDLEEVRKRMPLGDGDRPLTITI